MSSIPLARLHPASCGHIKKGHPWITIDRYTDRFPRDRFLIGIDENEHPVCLFLNDPDHPKVKGRVWSCDGDFEKLVRDFRHDVGLRIQTAIAKRTPLDLSAKRDNHYLVFGEADQLPGLFILKLGSTLLIQLYTSFWKSELEPIMRALGQMSYDAIWVQERNRRQSPPSRLWGKGPDRITLSEYGIHYDLHLNDKHDIGLYTDMSAIREKLIPILSSSKRVLNLFSYTGALSFFAMKQGAQVTSVDLSKHYMAWLEHNLTLNPDLDPGRHKAVISSAVEYLRTNTDYAFDLIICDPPSVSTNGKKRETALDFYQHAIPLMKKRLNPNGQVLAFLNHHTTTRVKFQNTLTKITPAASKGYHYGLIDDCPRLPHFPEGDYLKGLLFRP